MNNVEKALQKHIGEPEQRREQRQMPVEELKTALEECSQRLQSVKSNLKSRPKTEKGLIQLQKQIFAALRIADEKFPENLVPAISELLNTCVEALLELDRSLGSGERNPARIRLIETAKLVQSRLTKPRIYHFDPLDDENLAESIARAFNSQPVRGLSELESFLGSGVYAIYYRGSFELYQKIAVENQTGDGSRAIYVGEAGRDKRKGVEAGDSEKIYARLADHKASIGYAKNLNVADFSVRYLPIRDLFIPLCESILIETHRPLWNMKLDGFGNKHVGESRKETQQMTKWDLLHPGRPNRATVERKGKYKTAADVAGLVKDFFSSEDKREERAAAGLPTEKIKVEELAEAPESLKELTAKSAGSPS